MKIMVLHRKRNPKYVVSELIGVKEVWVVGRITPEMRSCITLAELVRIPVYYDLLTEETIKRLFGK